MSRYDYDIIVIGGGAAGLTSSGICASFGAKTALIEKSKLGGDCTWYGCVPSKSLLHIAKGMAAIEELRPHGLQVEGVKLDFSAVMESVRKTRQHIYEDADSPELMSARGVRVLEGSTSFTDPHTVELTTGDDIQTITFRSAIVTAGASPLVLPIQGLANSDFLTNETIFEIKVRPDRLVILGNGPIGVEMAQAFSLLGSDVTVIALDPRILIRDEEKCAEIVQKRLESHGVTFYSRETIHNITRKNDAYELSVGPQSGPDKTMQADALLIAVGRKPNLDPLKLENAGVNVEKGGIPVDRSCRTNVKHIFAAGDITTFMKFTHVAENMAKTAAVNAVLRMPVFRYEHDVVPWVTYTQPECAHVGKTAEELRAKHVKFDTIEFPYSKIDRAVLEHTADGLIILHNSRGKILGAHAVGSQAGEIINEYALAMKNGLRLSKISDTVHPYPTLLLGARRAADQYYVRLQEKWMSRLVRFIFRYKGKIPEYVGSRTVL